MVNLHVILLFNIFVSLAWQVCSYQVPPISKRRIIVDVDAGIDDAFALFTLFDADRQGLIKVEAIVCSYGNTNVFNTCRNVLRLLRIFERTDIPVYRGANNSIIKSNQNSDDYFGKDGLGDVHHESEPELNLIRKEPAAVAIYNIIKQNPKEITYVCLGPLTNPALSFKIYQDLTSNIRDIFIMGGNYLEMNSTDVPHQNSTADFNFLTDPEAAHIILNESQCPITLLIKEACHDTTITADWRFNVLGKYNSTFMDLLNRAESKRFSKGPLTAAWVNCDTFLTLSMLYPDVVVQKKRQDLTVDLHGNLTRGEAVVKGHEENEKSEIVLIEKVDSNKVKNILIDMAKRFIENE